MSHSEKTQRKKQEIHCRRIREASRVGKDTRPLELPEKGKKKGNRRFWRERPKQRLKKEIGKVWGGKNGADDWTPDWRGTLKYLGEETA